MEILEKSGECPTVATLMCITWNILEFYALSPATHPAHVAASADFLPDPRTRLSDIAKQQHDQLVAPIQTKPIKAHSSTFKSNSYEYCKKGVTKKKSCMATALWKHMINLRCFCMCAMMAIMMMHHTETPGRPGQPQVQHQSEALPGARADFSFSCSWSAASCLQWQRKLLVWKKWCLRQLSYLYLWIFMYILMLLAVRLPPLILLPRKHMSCASANMC